MEFETQFQLGQMIDRFLINLKKDGPNRRRSQSYISGHLDTITRYWTEFEARHGELVLLNNSDHEYFLNDFHGQVKTAYEATINILHDDKRYFSTQMPTVAASEMKITDKEQNQGTGSTENLSLATGSTADKEQQKIVETITNNNQEDLIEKVSATPIQQPTRKYKLQGVDMENCAQENREQTLRCRRLEVKFNFFEKHLEELQNSLTENLSKTYYELKKVALLTNWEKIQALYEEIAIHEEDVTNSEHYYLKLNDIEDKFQRLIILIEEKHTSSENNAFEDHGVRLPRISIPIFDGDYKTWSSFHDIFVKMIHSQEKLGNALKMQYLKCHIRGEASRLIQHLELSGNNYNAAWDLLRNRYDNKRLLLNTYLENIINQPTMNKESAQDLKRLHDKTKEAVQGIEGLKIDTSSWGPILVHIIIKKLDKETFKIYEQSLMDPKGIPDFNELLVFLENRFQSLESIEASAVKRESEKRPHITRGSNQSYRTFHTTLTIRCIFCNENHYSFKCDKLQSISPKERLDTVKKNKLCINCLRKGHEMNKCPSKNTCLKCNLKHNTLLHEEQRPVLKSKVNSSEVVTLFSTRKENISKVLLATALVKLEANDGTTRTIKALIDQGSQASFISERIAQGLGFKRSKTNITVKGIHAQHKSTALSSITIKIFPRFESQFELTVTTFVLDKLTNLIPEVNNDTMNWHHIKGVILADPEFYKQGKIDMILGADVYGDILLDGILKGNENSPIAQQTELGWIISGKCGTHPSNNITSMIATIDLEDLKKFWEVEEVPEQRELSEEDKRCIQYFESSVSRNKQGRYIVRLPFQNSKRPTELNDNKRMAISRLLHMEKRFRKDKELEDQYKKFMKDYLELGHMRLCKGQPSDSIEQHFLPHHAVMKHESKTTKLRVVFDGSAKGSTGKSLNSLFYTGPPLQPELYDILIQWRRYRFAYKADIEKMFRQILVHEDDQCYQKIVWRFSESEPIQEYQLATVTYGTRPAPFLAVKTMQHLADQAKAIYPKGAEQIFKNFYMDDLLAGSNTIEGARVAINEITKLLSSAGFHLRQWSSNNNRVLCEIPTTSIEARSSEIAFTDSIKTLGLHWNPLNDHFTFKISTSVDHAEPTKRSILSDTSRLFDPIGWLAPVILKAKLLSQEIWTLGFNWDDKLPNEIVNRWQEYRDELSLIEKITIPRWVNCKTRTSPGELHGFSDASEKAYSAVIYLKNYDEYNNVMIHLLSAKTKVAPNNKKISIPRLELCGALLLAKLMRRVISAMDLPFAKTYAWTDSEIVIAWLNGNPNKYKTFVANRISKIKSTLERTNWHHVSSKDNPADCASRGIGAAELANHKLWWTGPDWLASRNTQYEFKPFKDTDEDKKATLVFTAILHNKIILDNIERFSSFERMKRTFGYCLRFINNCRGRKTSGPLTVSETQLTANLIIIAIQKEEFSNEYAALCKKQPVNPKSFLLSLNPFIDENGLIRVGGRLENSDLTYEIKHPIVLPYKHHITKLVILHAHNRTMHGGVSLTLSYTRNKYWILKGHTATKQILRGCVRCARYNARVQEQIMGNLPKVRLTMTRAFTNVGVDYAGPLQIKLSKGRGNRLSKGYIAAFICLVTKAVHLEAVSDLTAEAFLAAFKRFVGRRGIPNKMYSDNATNFQLASKILERNLATFKTDYQDKLLDELRKYEVEWSFIPPAAPHFGGLWEVGIKSLKQHLKRTIGETALTFEELSTILTNIESVLNSRPLCPLTDDPNDLSVLTPGHFLIGSSLLTLPGKDIDPSACLKSRWKLLEHLQQQICKRWYQEYLHRLQCRPKWTANRENLKINDLVLLKDEAVPPGKWPLGRVVETHPGEDQMTRVVTVRTKYKLIKRPITKLCLLPVNEPEKPRGINQPSNEGDDKTERRITRKRRKIHPVSYYPKPTTSRPPKIGNFTILIIIALFFGLIAADTSSSSIEITPFASHPGIYFEELGETQLITDEWHILAYYDLRHYWDQLNGIRNCISEIQNLCNITEVRKNMYLEILEQMRKQYQQIEELNHLIHEQGVSKPPLRQRRSPLNIVGKAANVLFGILDEDYAKNIDERISTMHQNEDHLLQLIKNQTSVMETTINILKSRDDSIKSQFKIIEDHIKDIRTQIHSSKSNLEVFQLFNILTIHTTLVLFNYERTQRSILEVLIDLHHGRINPLIITPTQLKSQIAIIRQNIPSTLTLPANGDQTELLLYGLMSAGVRIMESRILFEIRLPLLKNEKYQLFHLVPVPTPHENQFLYIEPDTPYLIINLHRDSYYPLSQFELDKCIHIEERRYLCHQNHPIYNTKADKAKCEITLLRHERKTPRSCNVQTIKPAKIWIQLKAINAWLYVMDKDYTFNVVCGSSVTSKNLQGEGILRLRVGCEIKEESMTISGNGVYTTEFNSSFIPSFNLSEILDDIKTPFSEPVFQIQHWNPSYKEYSSLKRKINKIHQEEKLATSLTDHHIHHYTMTYVLLAIILPTACALLYKVISTRRRRKSSVAQDPKPIPKRRNWTLPSTELHI